MGGWIGLGVPREGRSDGGGLRVVEVSMMLSSPPGGVLTVGCGQFASQSVSSGTQLLLSEKTTRWLEH